MHLTPLVQHLGEKWCKSLIPLALELELLPLLQLHPKDQPLTLWPLAMVLPWQELLLSWQPPTWPHLKAGLEYIHLPAVLVVGASPPPPSLVALLLKLGPDTTAFVAGAQVPPGDGDPKVSVVSAATCSAAILEKVHGIPHPHCFQWNPHIYGCMYCLIPLIQGDSKDKHAISCVPLCSQCPYCWVLPVATPSSTLTA